MTFKCGHPKTPENSKPSGYKWTQCRLCWRVKAVIAQVERDQARINRGQRVRGVVGQ